MAIENVKKFFELVKSDEELAREIAKIKDEIQNKSETVDYEQIISKKVIPLAKKHGLDFTMEDFLKYTNSMVQQGELSDDDLLNVSGGMNFKQGVVMGLTLLTLGTSGLAMSGFTSGGGGSGSGGQVAPSTPDTSYSQNFDTRTAEKAAKKDYTPISVENENMTTREKFDHVYNQIKDLSSVSEVPTDSKGNVWTDITNVLDEVGNNREEFSSDEDLTKVEKLINFDAAFNKAAGETNVTTENNNFNEEDNINASKINGNSILTEEEIAELVSKVDNRNNKKTGENIENTEEKEKSEELEDDDFLSNIIDETINGKKEIVSDSTSASEDIKGLIDGYIATNPENIEDKIENNENKENGGIDIDDKDILDKIMGEGENEDTENKFMFAEDEDEDKDELVKKYHMNEQEHEEDQQLWEDAYKANAEEAAKKFEEVNTDNVESAKPEDTAHIAAKEETKEEQELTDLKEEKTDTKKDAEAESNVAVNREYKKVGKTATFKFSDSGKQVQGMIISSTIEDGSNEESVGIYFDRATSSTGKVKYNGTGSNGTAEQAKKSLLKSFNTTNSKNKITSLDSVTVGSRENVILDVYKVCKNTTRNGNDFYFKGEKVSEEDKAAFEAMFKIFEGITEVASNTGNYFEIARWTTR